ncbi:MAG: hypothetical protein ABI632_10210 [Pseudolysinimonas sp.]
MSISPARRIVASIALAAGTVGMLLATATPASAAPGYDSARCDGSPYSSEGSAGEREFFTPDLSLVPPPLRTYAATCASRITNERADDVGITNAYNLIYVGLDYRTFIRMLQDLGAAGWDFQDFGRNIDLGDGAGPQHLGLSLSELDALSSPPWLVQGAVLLPSGSELSFQWSDGTHSSLYDGWKVPHLVFDVLLTERFSAQGIADPSVLSSLRTFADALPTPTQSVVIVGSSIMLMLVVGWPGSLLNSVIGARWDAFSARLQSRRKSPEPASSSTDGIPAKPRRTAPRWLAWPGLVLAALIGGFVDPAFGFNAMSARVVVSGLLSLLVFNVAAWSLAGVIIRRIEPRSAPYIKFRWGSLLVLLGAVVLARLLDFNPGVIFGLVAGLAFGMTLARSREAVVVVAGAAFALVVSMLGWTGYSLLAPLASSQAGNPVAVFATEFFSGLTIEGVSSLPLALLPFALLDGGKLFGWKKWVWAIAYTAGLAVFMLVLLTIPDSFGQIPGDFLRWIGLFVAFGVIAIVIVVIDRAATRRKARAPATAA